MKAEQALRPERAVPGPDSGAGPGRAAGVHHAQRRGGWVWAGSTVCGRSLCYFHLTGNKTES